MTEYWIQIEENFDMILLLVITVFGGITGYLTGNFTKMVGAILLSIPLSVLIALIAIILEEFWNKVVR